MSVLIKGMKMPDNCGDCPLYSHIDNVCQFDNTDMNYDDKPPWWCPLVELPEKHGDLIDKKVLNNAVLKWLPPDPCGREEMEFPYETDICVSMLMEVEEQPTVIEAEGE